jgi:hypothetical protein
MRVVPMALEGNFEYGLTRVQSQHGARADALEWRRLEGSHDLGQYLEGARAGLFGSWIASLDRNRDAHAIERTLRAAWRHYVRTVAGWHPRRWQPWLIWLEWLPSLTLSGSADAVDPVHWWAQWQRLRPPVDADTERLLVAFFKALRQPEPREQLRVRLERVFRRAAGTAVATLCHLALMALDLERLRGGLVTRCLFPGER